ncbi:MAG: hypothetical protein U9Q34_06860 [Elusimicrobiota bacterium]|nr:hypothetical protein [Elusimicrobiota bacterium]
MRDKIVELEKLINSAIPLIKKLEEENELLQKQVASLIKERDKTNQGNVKTKEFKDWRQKVKKKLSKLCIKIEKASSQQDELFTDYGE